MLRLATLSIFIVFLFANCQKENTDMKVSYKIKETSSSTPTYNISYTTDKSGGTSSVSSSLDSWSKDNLILKRGQFVTLTLDCTDPTYDFTIDIVVDGAIWKEAELHNPTSSITVSGTLNN